MPFQTKIGLRKEFELFWTLSEKLNDDLSLLDDKLGIYTHMSDYHRCKERHQICAQLKLLEGHMADISREYQTAITLS